LKKLLTINLILLSLLGQARVNIDSLWSVWENPKTPDTLKLEALQKIAWNGYLYTKPDSSFYVAQLQHDYAQKKGYKKYMATAINIQGASLAARGNFDEAIIYYSKSLKIRKEIDDKKGVAVCLSNIGIVYKTQGDIPKALDYYHKSLKMQEELGNKHGIASALTNIGIIYKAQEDYSKALEYYTKSLNIRKEENDERGIAYEMNNIGILHTKQNNYDKALEYYNKARKIQLKIDDKKGLALSLVNISSVYLEQEKYNLSIEYYNKALDIREQISDKKGITRALGSLGIIQNLLGNHQQVISLSGRSLSMAKSLGLAAETRDAAFTLYQSYKSLGNQKEALKNYELYITMKDSLTNDKIKNELLKQQYQIKEDSIKAFQEKKDALAKADQLRKDEIAQKETEKKNLIITAGVIGTILGLLFTILVFNRLRLTRKQKAIIEEQKLIVEEKNTEILDSINYAKRIQKAILPPDADVKKYLPNSFILYKPKDIVAGDFYWMESISSLEGGLKVGENHPSHFGKLSAGSQRGGLILFAAADCTGHGVPGAMVSVVCNNALNRSVREYGLTEPGLILDKTREIVIQEFEKSKDDVKDGMDIALCSLEMNSPLEERSRGVLKYAGAHNPLWIITSSLEGGKEVGEKSPLKSPQGGKWLVELKANKQPIGKFTTPTPYTTHTIHLQKGDTIYIFTDGYVDQFGGEKEKKFKAKAFRELLLSIQDKTMEEQKIYIDNVFETWRGNIEQIDDVCVLGIRI